MRISDNHNLSEREIEILKLLAKGKSNKEIAGELFISANTVKVHVRNIFSKLEVSSRTEATIVAIREGLVPGPPVEDDIDRPEPALAPVDPDPAQPVTTPVNWYWIAGTIVSLLFILLLVAWIFRPSQPELTATEAAPVPVESQWQEQPELPDARTGLAAASFEGQIYIAGGEIRGQPSGNLAQFDPSTGTWTNLAEKPTPVSNIQAAVLGGQIYFPGGEAENGVTPVVEVYNPRTDSWAAASPLPQGISSYSLVSFEGRLYLFGGWDGEHSLDDVFSYSPDLDSWTQLSDMPAPLAYTGAAVNAGQIYLVGGYDGNQAVNTNYIYNPTDDQSGLDPWKMAAPIPDSRYAMGLVSIADKIHLIGGQGGDGSFFSQMDYSPQTDIWQTFENPLAGTWSNFGMAAIGTEIYVFGGLLNGQPVNRSLSYTVLFVVVIPVVR